VSAPRTMCSSQACEEAAPNRTLVWGCITVISPGGEILRQVTLPGPMIATICFGGPGLKTAYITMSGTGKRVSMERPEPGLRLPYY
jgi:gluconolactonase